MDLIQAFISMLIILGPFANIFIFDSILDSFGIDKKEKKYAIKKAFLLAYAIWLPIFIFGNLILKAFSINLSSFRIAGGLFLFYIALEILTKDVPTYVRLENKYENLEKILMTPMAVPLLTGPGVITTTLIYRSLINSIFSFDFILLFLIFSLAYLTAFLIIYNGTLLVDRLGKNFMIVLNRLMGLILLAISIEFIISGVLEII